MSTDNLLDRADRKVASNNARWTTSFYQRRRFSREQHFEHHLRTQHDRLFDDDDFEATLIASGTLGAFEHLKEISATCWCCTILKKSKNILPFRALE